MNRTTAAGNATSPKARTASGNPMFPELLNMSGGPRVRKSRRKDAAQAPCDDPGTQHDCRSAQGQGQIVGGVEVTP